MPDGSGGAAGAVAEAIGKVGGNLFGGIKNEALETVKAAGSQVGISSVTPTTSHSQQQPQQSIQKMKQEDTATRVPREAAITEELRQIGQQNQNGPSHEVAPQTQTQQSSQQPQNQKQSQPGQPKNGQDSVLAKRLFEDVQSWGEEALQRQKQEAAQKKQQEEAEEQQKKQEEESRKLEAPTMPGSQTKGPGAQKKQAQPLSVIQSQTKGETGRSAKG